MWADVEENIVELFMLWHNDIHYVFWNKLPHNIVREIINTICKPFREELKEALLWDLDAWAGDEYKPNTYIWDYPIDWPHEWKLAPK